MENYAELIYVSQAKHTLPILEIKSILETARINNAQKDITGLLCFDGHQFLQIIEGPKHNIKDLYAQIAKDNRHDHVDLIHFDKITERTFTRWQMAFKGLPKNLIATLSDHSSLLNFSEARGTLEQRSFKFGAGLFSIIMDSTYHNDQLSILETDLEFYQTSFTR